MKVVLLSDTHGFHWDLSIPDGDLLIHAGDFCRRGTLEEVADFNHFMAGLPHRHKVVVAGNHDWPLQREPQQARSLLKDVHYLQDQALEVEGLSLYGSPWQPVFFDWAFNLPRGPALAAKWSAIPAPLDILITHTPPYGIGDKVQSGDRVGCEALRERLPQVQPRVHVFGHIHEDYGHHGQRDGTDYFNGSNCTLSYQPHNPVLVFNIEPLSADDRNTGQV